MEVAGAHILVFPYPAQGHMLTLLDLTHHLAIRGLTITVLLTPQNLPFLNPLLSRHPTLIKTLVLPFPENSSIPAGIENVKDLPPDGFRSMMVTLGQLHDPLLHWFQNHPSPPVAIISDLFLGWTHHLACRLGIRRFMFSPSGATAICFVDYLWRFIPKRKDPTDANELIPFPTIPKCPSYPYWQISPVYRSYVEGDPNSEFFKDGFLANMASWGIVINSFSELESISLDHLKKEIGHDRVWTVGPLLPPGDDPLSTTERGGSSSVLASEISSWLDSCDARTVVYVCFGSQAVLTNRQMEEVALGLEKSGTKFIWAVKEATKEHAEGSYGMIPHGFKDRVSDRGLVVKGWAPQVMILRHRAVGAFLSHCGWNSVLESIVAGVPMLAWPMGADQFINATLLVEELKVGVRVCEGAQIIPNSSELARLVKEAIDGNQAEKARAVELQRAALDSISRGSSFNNLDGLTSHFAEMVVKKQ